ncbi:hypothetical protein QJS10_CPA03g00583 [Acorus calamus]|uniref:Uncharacterized protein n=1 Tax=Acorus calamus TaxID=4465 RepID=A0AAV9F922_ACOCL|nr:hypothetical protein QJS10_CPA03g00583 [Acorus calamus]
MTRSTALQMGLFWLWPVVFPASLLLGKTWRPWDFVGDVGMFVAVDDDDVQLIRDIWYVQKLGVFFKCWVIRDRGCLYDLTNALERKVSKAIDCIFKRSLSSAKLIRIDSITLILFIIPNIIS